MQLPKLLPQTKKKAKEYVDQNPIEAVTSIGSGVKSTLTEEGKTAVSEAWEQLLGIELGKNDEKGGDLSAGEEINFSEIKHAAHEVTEMGHEFIQEVVHAGRIATQENTRETQVKVQEILIELKQLAQSTNEVQAEIEVISAQQTVDSAGTYHVNFLENMLSWLRDARANVEDSLAWFQALRSKKSARQYGSMSKKHGTSFTLSNERTAATQTG